MNEILSGARSYVFLSKNAEERTGRYLSTNIVISALRSLSPNLSELVLAVGYNLRPRASSNDEIVNFAATLKRLMNLELVPSTSSEQGESLSFVRRGNVDIVITVFTSAAIGDLACSLVVEKSGSTCFTFDEMSLYLIPLIQELEIYLLNLGIID